MFDNKLSVVQMERQTSWVTGHTFLLLSEVEAAVEESSPSEYERRYCSRFSCAESTSGLEICCVFSAGIFFGHVVEITGGLFCAAVVVDV